MDPQTFVRVSIGSLGLWTQPTRAPSTSAPPASSLYSCEIRLRGFPTQTAAVPLLPSPEAVPERPIDNPAVVFYLGESDVKALMVSRCLRASGSCLEVAVYRRRRRSRCGYGGRRRKVGTFRLRVGPQWGEGRPALLHSGWVDLGRSLRGEDRPPPELHLRVNLDPDPRYVFQFEDETALSPQVVQLQGTIKQPIFSCKFNRERRASQAEATSSCWSNSNSDDADGDGERRERKGWRVMIHDLSGSAVAAAFMATPFVPSTGSDWVARSNPGAWLILRPDPRPAGELASLGPPRGLARERRAAGGESVCCRLFLLPEGRDDGVQIAEAEARRCNSGRLPADAAPLPGAAGGFVMNCTVRGEGKSSKPLVQLAVRHVTCVEDAAIFMALAAAVDLSIQACGHSRGSQEDGTVFFFPLSVLLRLLAHRTAPHFLSSLSCLVVNICLGFCFLTIIRRRNPLVNPLVVIVMVSQRRRHRVCPCSPPFSSADGAGGGGAGCGRPCLQIICST
ncbi:unnamed protein product [Spirodela intermedia]|uniref:Uncharacterized protein n=1 Tax=Spirodela intermedia TaxID=51605 RepID=A0A7I8JR75_SPIIN|nr:unnamed protein product [Spirodela intermedia]CAA6672083.1 unnamed protein product [Spirodela intermedia]